MTRIGFRLISLLVVLAMMFTLVCCTSETGTNEITTNASSEKIDQSNEQTESSVTSDVATDATNATTEEFIDETTETVEMSGAVTENVTDALVETTTDAPDAATTEAIVAVPEQTSNTLIPDSKLPFGHLFAVGKSQAG